MSPRIPLPDDLDRRGFTREQARDAGLTQGRLRRRDVLRPYHGVLATIPPADTAARCRAYAARLKPGQFFSHGTAAQLLGIPVPLELEQEEELHVGAVLPADAPHAKGVRGHRLLTVRSTRVVAGLPVVDAPEVFCELGATLGLEDLVVIADHLMNLTNADEQHARTVLLERIATIRRVGSARLVRSVGLCRRGSRSPAETRVRLVLEAAGLPRAELNDPIEDEQGRYLGSPDLVWREHRVVLEYEGDGHRVDRDQFRYDIRRYEALAAAGWRVLRATGDDLTPAGRERLVRRVSAALAH